MRYPNEMRNSLFLVGLLGLTVVSLAVAATPRPRSFPKCTTEVVEPATIVNLKPSLAAIAEKLAASTKPAKSFQDLTAQLERLPMEDLVKKAIAGDPGDFRSDPFFAQSIEQIEKARELLQRSYPEAKETGDFSASKIGKTISPELLQSLTDDVGAVFERESQTIGDGKKKLEADFSIQEQISLLDEERRSVEEAVTASSDREEGAKLREMGNELKVTAAVLKWEKRQPEVLLSLYEKGNTREATKLDKAVFRFFSKEPAVLEALVALRELEMLHMTMKEVVQKVTEAAASVQRVAQLFSPGTTVGLALAVGVQRLPEGTFAVALMTPIRGIPRVPGSGVKLSAYLIEGDDEEKTKQKLKTAVKRWLETPTLAAEPVLYCFESK